MKTKAKSSKDNSATGATIQSFFKPKNKPIAKTEDNSNVVDDNKCAKTENEKEGIKNIEKGPEEIKKRPLSSTVEDILSKKENRESSAQAPTAANLSTELFVDKYAPKSKNDLINGGGHLSTIIRWLDNWDNNHGGKTTKPINSKDPMNAKALLLSGKPGLGKTSTAKIACAMLNLDVVEINASDQRNKSSLNNLSIGKESISFHDGKTSLKRTALIVDEVDGMSGSDRGGNAELIKMIKSATSPIICICNDRYNNNVKSLANYCMDIKFVKPDANSILPRLKMIVKSEGMNNISDKDLMDLVQQSDGDIRSCINSLQFFGGSLSFSGKKDDELKTNFFDATIAAFSNKPLDERERMYFVDPDMVSMLIQQNYPVVAKTSRQGEIKTMEQIAKSAEFVSYGDVFDRQIHENQRWEFLPAKAMMDLGAAYHCRGNLGFAGFPEFLGRLSTANKKKRVLTELQTSLLKEGFTGSLKSDLFFVIQIIQQKFTASQNLDIGSVVDEILSLGFSRDDIFEGLNLFKFKEEDLISVDTKVKTQFTRIYNLKSQQVLGGDAKKIKMTKSEVKVEDIEEDENMNEDMFLE